MSRFTIVAVSILALCSIALAGCGGDGKKTVKVGNDSFTASEKLPDSFPNDFPIYGGADFKGSISTTQEGEKGLAATWETGDSLDKVKSYYNDQFGGKSAWTQDSATDTGQGAFYAVHKKSDATKAGFVTLASQGDKTSFIVFIGDNLNAAGSDSTPSGKTCAAATADTSSGSDNTPAAAADLPAEAKLSDGFPRDRVPFPSGARVTSTSSVSSGGQNTYFVEIYVKDSPEKVSTYFKDELPKHNWTNSLVSQTNGEYFLSFSGDNNDAVIIQIDQSDTPGYAKASISVSTGTAP
jgi:hypothetical protein